MKKPSLPTVIITILWLAYLSVTAYVFYAAIGPVERDLVNILVGFALPLLIATGMLFLPTRRNRLPGDDEPRVRQPKSTRQA